jgi:hypothetical protein
MCVTSLLLRRKVSHFSKWFCAGVLYFMGMKFAPLIFHYKMYYGDGEVEIFISIVKSLTSIGGYVSYTVAIVYIYFFIFCGVMAMVRLRSLFFTYVFAICLGIYFNVMFVGNALGRMPMNFIADAHLPLYIVIIVSAVVKIALVLLLPTAALFAGSLIDRRKS